MLLINEIEFILRVMEMPLGRSYTENNPQVLAKRKKISALYEELCITPWPEYDNKIPGLWECTLRARAIWLQNYLTGKSKLLNDKEKEWFEHLISKYESQPTEFDACSPDLIQSTPESIED